MTDVVMPQMGESIVEGTLTKWLKKAGERIERDEPLFEISTDKVDTEIPSPAAGVLSEILVEEGNTVAINTIVARIDEGGSGAAAPAKSEPDHAAPEKKPDSAVPPKADKAPDQQAAAEAESEDRREKPKQAAAPAPEPQAKPAGAEVQGPLSPLVKRMAREYNIDLRQVKGTGAGGRITKADIESYISAQAARTVSQAQAPAEPAPAQPAAPAQAAPQMPAPEMAQPPAPAVPRAEQAKTRVEPMSIMRSKIAEHMVFSKRTSAHVTTVHRVDMTKVAKLRERHKSEFQARYGFSLTFLPFVARAAAEALRAYPIVNASLEGNNILYHNEINIGIAVALENGLIVPVIRQADEKTVVGLQRSIVDLAARARSRQLKPDEVQGGTFSITNFGTYGSVFATPVINQPQVAILGVGAVEKIPVVIDDAIAIRSSCYLSLTFDHRLIDGALADQFTGKVKSILENWSEEVL
ncbi:MAG: 2-oxoglutarate dehydrogenase, E2 component, dihydrolipoamide succinyltransferase [Bryobacteraceae bacterium]|nr:2-oxoglutarate dehydrogenase, E2 component, dihydrolipoamide succinyltransferase [Bryobacterales bacterium]MEB2360449.1 2-oxoglutarate dehydrogenase, E2 component, dihydrolipoamide succinyltransferase [Bryobacterales bacterium]NUN01189.1 2-oxoglutarate dehydrogenase, E2 component, dihydrolipoamide succinyltransferase [Bryobacteraceae bacterium]